MTGAAPVPARGFAYGLAACAMLLAPLLAIAASAYWLSASRGLDAMAAEREPAVAALERRAAMLDSQASEPRDAAAIYLPGETASLAKASLQRLLVDAIDRSSGRLIEVDGADLETDDSRDVTARLRLIFDVRNAALLDILHEIETGLPLLTVDRIEIRRLDEASNGDPTDPTLRVMLVVVGQPAIGKG